MSSRNVISFKRHGSEPDRFEALMRPHFDVLYAAARRMTLSQPDAEDLLQDVCLKVYLRLDELERIEYRRAWLLKVLYHAFIDTRRGNRRSPIDLSDTGADSVDPDIVAEGAWQPDEMTDREMRIERVLNAMSRLNQDQCALVALHDVEGLTIDELKALTGMPDGTIKAQLHRTRAKLGRLLSNDAVLQPHLKVIGGKQ